MNKTKTNEMLSTCKDTQHIDSQITATNYTFYVVDEFDYIGSSKTYMILEFKLKYSYQQVLL